MLPSALRKILSVRTLPAAALETGRKAIGIEIDERWVEVARRRLERWHAQGRLDFGNANTIKTPGRASAAGVLF